MNDSISEIYFADAKAKAVFAADEPKPQFLMDTPKFKAAGRGTGGRRTDPPSMPAKRRCITFSKVKAR